jgi:DNA-binding LacI/PurR family transcriptional regulator
VATRNDVAKLANVSTATVSHVLNGTKYVNDDLRQRVRQAIKDLDYRPNLIAKSLSSKKSQHVAFVVNDLQNPTFADIFCSFETEAKKHDYFVSIIPIQHNMSEYIDGIIGRNLDGIFVSTVEYSFNQEQIERLRDYNIAIVTGDIILEGCTYVRSEYMGGMVKAINYLKELGHENIGYLYGLGDDTLPHSRLWEFRNAMVKCGLHIQEENIILGESPFSSKFFDGYRDMGKLLSRSPNVTAVFALNDLMAAGAIKAAIDKGLHVPQDISVVGCDNSMFAKCYNPPITSISTNKQEIGRQAFLQILTQTNNGDAQDSILEVDLVIRKSTDKCRSATDLPREKGCLVAESAV